MKELTTQQKIEIVKETRELYEDRWSSWLCHCADEAMNLLGLEDYSCEDFPEFIELGKLRRSPDPSFRLSWWPRMDTESRLNFLDELQGILEAKLLEEEKIS